ncbi:MAG TPA: biopolymer transporter ExbD [Longimicrobium sp.]|jgi:biopolymer transport protein ExbD/biopolymer transport protein TolR
MALGMAGRRGGVAHTINVTPMIDVLLVLLVIFMVVQQGLRRGVSVQVPTPDAVTPPGPEAIVLEVEPGGRYFLNTRAVAAAALQAELARAYAGRPRKVLFVKGSERLAYGEVVAAVDAGRAAGVEAVGLVPRASGAPR